MNIDRDCSIFVFWVSLETVGYSSSGRGEEGQHFRVGGTLRRSLERLLSRLAWRFRSRQPFRIHDNGEVKGALAKRMAGTE